MIVRKLRDIIERSAFISLKKIVLNLFFIFLSINGITQTSEGFYNAREFRNAKNKAIKEIRTDSSHFPSKSHLILAKSLARLGDYREAVLLIDSILMIDRHNIDALIEKGRLFSIQSEFDSSLRILNEVLLAEPSNPKVLHAIGAYYHYPKEEYFYAETYIRKALDIDPDSKMFMFNLAVLYIKIQRFDESIELLNEFIKVSPNYGHPYYSLGLAYFYLKKRKESLRYLKKAKKNYHPQADPEIVTKDQVKNAIKMVRKRM